MICRSIIVTVDINPGTYRERVGCPKVFLSFVVEDKTLASDVFSSCSLIPRAHFESSSVMVSFYGYEI